MRFNVSQTQSIGGVGCEMDEANLADVHMRGPPATLVNTVEESQELHFEKGGENQPLSSLQAARCNTLGHPKVESRENRLQESHGGAVPVPHSSMQLPDRPVSLTPSNLSILITAHFSFALCPGLPCGSSRYKFWHVGPDSEGAALPRHSTCSEELPGHIKGSNHWVQWLQTGIKLPGGIPGHSSCCFLFPV